MTFLQDKLTKSEIKNKLFLLFYYFLCLFQIFEKMLKSQFFSCNQIHCRLQKYYTHFFNFEMKLWNRKNRFEKYGKRCITFVPGGPRILLLVQNDYIYHT